MAEASALWNLLQEAAEPSVVEALKTAVETDPDRALNRINPLAFAAAHGLDEDATIGALVHAARLGICSTCRGTWSAPAAAACWRRRPR